MKNKSFIAALFILFIPFFSFAQEAEESEAKSESKGNAFKEIMLDIVTNYGGTVEDGDFIINAGLGYDFNREKIQTEYFPPVLLSVEYTKQCGPCPLGFGFMMGYYKTGYVNLYTNETGFDGNYHQVSNNYLITTTFGNYHMKTPVKWLDVYAGLQLGAVTNICQKKENYKSISTGQLVNEEEIVPDTSFYWGCDMGATLYFGKVIGVNVEIGYPVVFKGCVSVKL